MANGFKTGGRNFPKGHKYSKGFPKLTPEQLELRRQIEKLNGKLILAKYCLMSFKDLKKKLLDESVPTIDLMIMRMIERCVSKAELPILIWIYTRLGWDADLSEQDNADIQKAKLIIKLDDNKKVSHLEAKEK